MRVLVQRVSQAEVKIAGRSVAKIEKGLLAYLSVAKTDTEADAHYIAEKLLNLRIFPDTSGKMNLSVRDIDGAVLLISNFTLHGDCRKGRRPGFDAAADPHLAERLYEETAAIIAAAGLTVRTGQFAQHMRVTATNDGPINFILDSKKLF